MHVKHDVGVAGELWALIFLAAEAPWNITGIWGLTAATLDTTAWIYSRTHAAPSSVNAAGVLKAEKSSLSAGSLMGAMVYGSG